ncbi:MAG: transposase [Nitrososphaerota archaeon]|nr:transposase [Nitrososphaerota archaeon]
MDIDSSMPREEECISTLREMMWPNGVIACPRCGSDRVANGGPRGRYHSGGNQPPARW